MQKEKTAMQIHIKDLHKIKQLVIDKKQIDAELKEIITETIEGCIINAQSHLGKEKNQFKKGYNEGAKWGIEVSSEDYFNQTFLQE